MKKLISLTLIAIMIFTAAVLPVSAASEPSLSRAAAESMILEAYRRFGTLKSNAYWGHTGSDPSKYWDEASDADSVSLMAPISIDDGKTVKITDSVNSVQYTWDYYYCLDEVYDPLGKGETGFLVFSSLNEVKAYGNEVFTDDLTEKALVSTAEIPSGDNFKEIKIKTFIEDSDGRLLCAYGAPSLFYNYDVLGFGEFSADADSATMSIDLGVRSDSSYGPIWIHSPETVEFTKTANGWRISGGTAFEVMLGEREATPNTGDTTATTAALLATISLVAILTPFALTKKRRTG